MCMLRLVGVRTVHNPVGDWANVYDSVTDNHASITMLVFGILSCKDALGRCGLACIMSFRVMS